MRRLLGRLTVRGKKPKAPMMADDVQDASEAKEIQAPSPSSSTAVATGSVEADAGEFEVVEDLASNIQTIFDQITCNDFPYVVGAGDEFYDDLEDLDLSIPWSERKDEMASKAGRYLRAMFGKYPQDEFQLFQFLLGFALGSLLVTLERIYQRNDFMLKIHAAMAGGMDKASATSSVGGKEMIEKVQATEMDSTKDQEDDADIEELPDDLGSNLTVRFIDLRKVKSSFHLEAALCVCDENSYLVQVQFPRTMFRRRSLGTGAKFTRGVSPKTIRACLQSQQNVRLNQMSILSWRWDIQKPSTLAEARDLKSDLVRGFLERERRRGTKLVWVDWMCVKQYGGFDIEELRDTNGFYAIIPPVIYPRLSGSAYAPSNIYKYTHLSSDYSARAWTSAEHAKMITNPRQRLGDLVPMDAPSSASLRERRRFELTAFFGIFLSGLSLPVMHRTDKFLYHDEPLMVGEILDMLYTTAMRSARTMSVDVAKDTQKGRTLMSMNLRVPFFEEWTQVDLTPSHVRTGLCTQVARRAYALRGALMAAEGGDAQRLRKITWKQILPWIVAHDELMKTAEEGEDKSQKERTLVPPKELGKSAKQVLDDAPCDKRVMHFIVRLVEVVEFLIDAAGGPGGSMDNLALFHPVLVSTGSELGIVMDFFLRAKPVLGAFDIGDLIGIADSMTCTNIPKKHVQVASSVAIPRSIQGDPEAVRLEKLKYLMTREMLAMMEFESIKVVVRPQFLAKLLRWMKDNQLVTAATINTVYGAFLGICVENYGRPNEQGCVCYIAVAFPEDEAAVVAKSEKRFEILETMLARLDEGGSSLSLECEGARYTADELELSSQFVYRELAEAASMSVGVNTTEKIAMQPSDPHEAASIAVFQNWFKCAGLDFEADNIHYDDEGGAA